MPLLHGLVTGNSPGKPWNKALETLFRKYIVLVTIYKLTLKASM